MSGKQGGLPKKINVFSDNNFLVQKKSKSFKDRLIEKVIGPCIDYIGAELQQKELQKISVTEEAIALDGGSHLSEYQIDRIKNFQTVTMDIDGRRQYFRENDHENTLHGISSKTVQKLLDDDSEIKTVLNIGCSYAYMDYLLAQKYPDKNFIGIDFPEDLSDFCRDLNAPNLKIISGYALDWLENTDQKIDLVYFSSTATTIKLLELKRYVSSLKEKVKYIVFSEPIYENAHGNWIDPDSQTVERSTPVYKTVNYKSDEFGYLAFVHNYKEILKEAGFDVVHYDVFVHSTVIMGWVVCVGVLKDNHQ